MNAGRRLVAVAVFLALSACTPPNLPAPLPPETTGTAPDAPVVGGVISVGVDANIKGFNPYVEAQYSPAASAISALVLPSVFAPGATGPDDKPTALVDDVDVTSTDPFTVTYNLSRGAAWSDGTPIAAEDFTYLWQQMTSNPGVVSPGGYQLIRGIQSLNAGKTVVVEFKTAYLDWRTLFSPLLPARTLKDEPGGFGATLETGIPIAGSRYRMEGYDPVIGQITLLRNDKYWAGETTTNTVVFRSGPAADLIESLRRGDLQALYLQPDAESAVALTGLGPTTRLIAVPLPAMVALQFNLDAGRTAADLAVRQAVAAGLNTASIREAVTEQNPAAAMAPRSQLELPADPAAGIAGPPADVLDNADIAQDRLERAGYRRSGLYYRLNGQVLTLILGYLVGDEGARAAARGIQQQLAAAGIQVDLVAQTEADSAAPLTAASVPDLRLTTVPRGASDRSVAVTGLDCANAFAAVTSTSTSTTSTSRSSATGTAAEPSRCTADIRETLAGFLGGADSEAALDAVMWRDLAAVPLAEPVAVLALGPALDSVVLPQNPTGLLWGGPLRNITDWPPPGS